MNEEKDNMLSIEEDFQQKINQGKLSLQDVVYNLIPNDGEKATRVVNEIYQTFDHIKSVTMPLLIDMQNSATNTPTIEHVMTKGADEEPKKHADLQDSCSQDSDLEILNKDNIQQKKKESNIRSSHIIKCEFKDCTKKFRFEFQREEHVMIEQTFEGHLLN